MSNRAFGDLIARRRTALKVSPEELAKRLGRKSKSVVYDLERGEQDPTVADLNILARELDVSIEELLLSLGARINPREAALLPYELVDDLLAIRNDPESMLSVRKAAKALRLLYEQSGGRP